MTSRHGKDARVDRREFGRRAGAGVIGAWGAHSQATPAGPTPAASTPPPGGARMKVGTQHGSSDDILTVLAALGVNHICSRLPSDRFDEHWTVDALTKLRERVESFGIHLEDRKSTRLNSSHGYISYAVFCLKKKKQN